jgi:hypothetical protein
MKKERYDRVSKEWFEKGKLEQKKEELRFLLNIQNWFDTATGQAYEVNERIKQLQKEIVGGKTR